MTDSQEVTRCTRVSSWAEAAPCKTVCRKTLRPETWGLGHTHTQQSDIGVTSESHSQVVRG